MAAAVLRVVIVIFGMRLYSLFEEPWTGFGTKTLFFWSSNVMVVKRPQVC